MRYMSIVFVPELWCLDVFFDAQAGFRFVYSVYLLFGVVFCEVFSLGGVIAIC